ncbi:hypothetical protein [Nitrospira sp. Nam80]
MIYNARVGNLMPTRDANEETIIMPRGREKDRKTRKKHRKNVQRVKNLVKARRAVAKKAKR